MPGLTNYNPHTTKLIKLVTLHSSADSLTSERATWRKLASIVKTGFKGADDGLLEKLLADGLFDLILEVLSDHSIPQEQIENYQALIQPARSVRVHQFRSSPQV